MSIDISNYYNNTVDQTLAVAGSIGRGENKRTSNDTLSFTDMLQLLVTQLQCQSIDDTTSTSEMMNQMTQMTSIQAMTQMTESIASLVTASTLSYASSLVGKEVTVGVFDQDGKLTEVVGTVTATGMYDGEAVVFLGDESYYLSDIMAVGRLPEKPEESGVEDPGSEAGSATGSI